jgi:Holliday junction DNA helicase RuvB
MKFSDIIGNDSIKTQLAIAAKASSDRNVSLPHSILSGCAGCGKTTTARSLAELLGVPFFQVDPASIKNTSDIISLVSKFPLDGYGPHGEIVETIIPPIIFIDEIHNLSLSGQEVLGIGMEDWTLSVMSKRGRTSEQRTLWLPHFTVIGATTLAGKLSKPFRDRFKLHFSFGTYSAEESLKILYFHAAEKNVEIEPAAALLISTRGRGVPRIIVRYLDQAIDFSHVAGKAVISSDIVEAMFSIIGIDTHGLSEADIKLMKCLFDNNGEPVGLDTLAVILNESPTTIMNEAEPYLIQKGYMIRTSRGRMLTETGEKYIGGQNKAEQNISKFLKE